MKIIRVLAMTMPVILLISLIVPISVISGGYPEDFMDVECEPFEDVKEKIMNSGTTDVPTWNIGDSWTYHQETLQENYTWHESDYMHMIETVTYTVSDIGWFEYRGETHYAYNLTLDGTVSSDSHGQSGGYNINVQGGTTDGWQLRRVSDLALIGDYQERDVDALVMGFLGLNIYIEQYRAYDPPYETYNFPLSLGNDFWANSTCEIWGYYETSGADSSEDEFGDVVDYVQEVGVDDSYRSVTVPEGTFDNTYYVVNYMNDSDGTDKGQGLIRDWYDEDVGNYVKQYGFVANFMSRDTTWTFELMSYDIAENSNTQTISPSTAKIGDTVTISGQFPGYPDEPITISIPEGADPVNEWSTTTDENGYYSIDIEVPFAEDDAETLEYFSSVGLVASLDINPAEELVVSSLVIMHFTENDLQLDAGWNFVSMDLMPWQDLDNMINDEEMGIVDQYTRLMYYDAEMDRWSSYVPGRAEHFNGLEHWEYTIGFWIYITEETSLTYLGYEIETTNMTLYPGWNMIGIPSSAEGNHEVPVEVTRVGYFDLAAEYNISYYHDPENFTFEPGQGYWVYNGASEEVQWEIDY